MITQTSPAATAPTSATAQGSGQFLTIGVGDETFALDIAQISEVLDLLPFTRIPNMPPDIRGVIDVRGRGIPVFDMRRKLGLPPADPTAHSRIVVLEMCMDQTPLTLGAMTDRVYEVTALDNDRVDDSPHVGMAWDSSYIRGIGRRNGQFVIVLDMVKLFAPDAPTLDQLMADVDEKDPHH